jgi:NDP-sugar pyrophosphorylase family protein
MDGGLSLMRAGDLFSVTEPFLRYFSLQLPPWEWLASINATIQLFAGTDGYRRVGAAWIHLAATVDASAHIAGRAIIGPGCQIRHNALLRDNVILTAGCVIGNNCEVKNSLLLDGCTIPHLNYVGDSILGAGSHVGAGAVLANLRLDGQPVLIHTSDGAVETGLTKCGSFVGDGVQIGCNAVLQPGTIIGKGSVVYPTVAIGGHVPPRHMVMPSHPSLRPMEEK